MKRRVFMRCLGCGSLVALSSCVAGNRAEVGDRHDAAENLAFCGLDCSNCDVYRYTAYGDKAALERAREAWAETAKTHWGMKDLDPAILNCHGCRSGGKIFKGCALCPVRGCAKNRGVESCADCPEWRHCESLAGLLTDCPEARENLLKLESGNG